VPEPTSDARSAAAPAAPTSAPKAPAAQTASSAGNLLTVRGKITSLDSQNSAFSIGTERIVWTERTQIFAVTKPMPISSLRVGRTVIVQVRLNDQGQFVAERIGLQPTVIHKPGPPPE
jgi:hypothetical protein